MKVYEALSKVQAELNVPKNHHNDFGNYYYRSAEDILNTVKPLLAKNGLTMFLSDEIISIGGKNYIRAKATLALDGDAVSVEAYARESDVLKGMSDSQITGSTSSYARKYALNGLFLIDDNKDDDTRDNTRKAETPKEPLKASVSQPIAPKEKKNITAEVIKATYNVAKARSEYEIETSDHEHFTVLIKKPIQEFEARQTVEVVGTWESEFHGKIYHMADNIKPLVSETEIPF